MCIKMEKTIIKFDDIKIPKEKLHRHKRPVSIKKVDIDKTVVSNKVPFGKKGMLKKLDLYVYFSQK